METLSLNRQARRWLLQNGPLTDSRQADLVILLKNVQEQAREQAQEEDKQMWINDATEPLEQELNRIKESWREFQDLMREK